ncbi:unnamed protein product [Rhizophagus irregularis]|uniref:Uncharacterized protein n=1 Tax=Rhizophagus irregularis TaxID=588596 RepID=A0A916EC72_9GLOM|nr:unnamed protein product [Rhizophagus irregularis]CAB5379422.1 unnamed protein product [Rhizophagus irregularis]
MGRKRTISSVLDENPITTRSPRVTTRSIIQPRIHKVPCFYVSEVIIENTEIRDNELSEVLENTEIWDNEPSEVLENTENINDESSQLTILNEQRVDRLPRRRRSRYISTRVSIGNISNIEQDLLLRESMAKDQSEDTNDNELNGDDESENNNSETFEDYSCPSFEPYQDPDKQQLNH